jgi:hypothetical protein
MLELAARKHANERIIAENKVVNQCRDSVKARNDHKRIGEDLDLRYIMGKGSIAYPG